MDELASAARPARAAHLDPARDEGFTLIEVMVSLAILMVISAATLTTLLVATRVVKTNQERVKAASVARTQADAMRALGATAIPLGQVTTLPANTPAGYRVTTTSSWVGLNQSTNPCDAASPGQAFVRVHVEVTSPELSTPQTIDTLVAPFDVAPTTGKGNITVEVIDEQGRPVSGVAVRGTDPPRAATNTFTQVTGTDGCVFAPLLVPTGSEAVAVSRAGFVPPTPGADQRAFTITADLSTRATFQLAQAATITFDTARPDYPVAPGLPVSWLPNQTGATVRLTTTGAAQQGLWPTVTGFSAWLGTCTDSDPGTAGAIRQSFALHAGQTTDAALAGQPVHVRGLAANQPVRLQYIGPDTACPTAPIALGATDALGRLDTTVPFGRWRLLAMSAQQDVGPLLPRPDGTPLDPLTVDFRIVDLEHPSPSPSGTSTGTPTGTPTP